MFCSFKVQCEFNAIVNKMTGDIIVNIEKLILNLKEMQQIKNSQDNLEKKNKRSYIGVIYIWRSYIT